MADVVKQYTNVIRTGGLQITEPRPADDRINVLDENAVIESFSAPFTPAENDFRAVLYDGLIIKSEATRISYVWAESDNGLLPLNYTYPPYDADYGNKTYNFVIFDSVVKLSTTYTNQSLQGIQVDNGLLPYHVLQDKDNATVVLKSSTTGFTEQEYPDRVESNTDGILIVMTPPPALAEEFKITIS